MAIGGIETATVKEKICRYHCLGCSRRDPPRRRGWVYAAINRLVRELLATWLYRSNGPQGRDPAWLASAGCYLFARTVRNTAWMYSLVSTVQTRRKMRHVLSAIAVLLALATTASAEEATTGPANADSATEDCSKQVWPNFSASCLRNADRALNVRLITASRR